jgi:hypothetical protein
MSFQNTPRFLELSMPLTNGLISWRIFCILLLDTSYMGLVYLVISIGWAKSIAHIIALPCPSDYSIYTGVGILVRNRMVCNSATWIDTPVFRQLLPPNEQEPDNNMRIIVPCVGQFNVSLHDCWSGGVYTNLNIWLHRQIPTGENSSRSAGQDIPAFYGTRRFITVIKSASRCYTVSKQI